jgi:O-antigen/teichoic acid export membrane protein
VRGKESTPAWNTPSVTWSSRRNAWPIAILADAASILVFAAVGRANHGESAGAGGIWHTAWPFLLGAALGLVFTAYQRVAPTAVSTGVRVWVWTLVIGMVVRGSIGGGTPIAFVIVAAVVLAALLIGWRGLLTWRRWRTPWRRLTS